MPIWVRFSAKPSLKYRTPRSPARESTKPPQKRALRKQRPFLREQGQRESRDPKDRRVGQQRQETRVNVVESGGVEALHDDVGYGRQDGPGHVPRVRAPFLATYSHKRTARIQQATEYRTAFWDQESDGPGEVLDEDGTRGPEGDGAQASRGRGHVDPAGFCRAIHVTASRTMDIAGGRDHLNISVTTPATASPASLSRHRLDHVDQLVAGPRQQAPSCKQLSIVCTIGSMEVKYGMNSGTSSAVGQKVGQREELRLDQPPPDKLPQDRIRLVHDHHRDSRRRPLPASRCRWPRWRSPPPPRSGEPCPRSTRRRNRGSGSAPAIAAVPRWPPPA